MGGMYLRHRDWSKHTARPNAYAYAAPIRYNNRQPLHFWSVVRIVAIKSLTLFTSCAIFTAVSGPAAPRVNLEPVPAPKTPTTAPFRETNLKGVVPILMYHRTGPEEKYMVRSEANFREDLARLYASGFRPVTLAEYASGKMPLKPGESPVVLTFDDSTESQFRILEDGTVDPKCFVGIWLDFAKTRPDFPIRGTFFVNPNGPFEQKALGAKKVEMLVGWGSEIAWHSRTHVDFSKVGDARVMAEMACGFEYLQKFGVTPKTFALPYGSLPRNRDLLKGFDWKGRRIAFEAVALAGSAPMTSPRDNPRLLRIQRIQAYSGPYGVDYWLNRFADRRVAQYVAGEKDSG